MVLWAERGVQRVWQNLAGGGTVQQSDPTRFNPGSESSDRSSKSIERRFGQAVISRALGNPFRMAPIQELEILEMALK